jgi:hypothetical protein
VGGRGRGAREDGADAREVFLGGLTVVVEVGNLGRAALASVSLLRGKRKKESWEEKWRIRTSNFLYCLIPFLALSVT